MQAWNTSDTSLTRFITQNLLYNYSISYADEGYKMMIKETNFIERIKNELYYWNNNNGDNQIDYTLCSITR